MIDGGKSKGIEGAEGIAWRKDLLRIFGHKLSHSDITAAKGLAPQPRNCRSLLRSSHNCENHRLQSKCSEKFLLLAAKMLRRRRFVDGMVVALIVEKQFDAGGRHENQ